MTDPSQSTGPNSTVGSIDRASGRIILQPFRTVEENLAAAREAEPHLQGILRQAVANVPGADLPPAFTRVKSPERATEKARVKAQAETRGPETIADYLGGRVVIDTLAAGDCVVENLRRLGRIVEDDPFYWTGRGTVRYRSRHVQLQLPNGMTAEIDVVPREVARVEPQVHRIYERLRAPDVDLAELRRLSQEGQRLFDDAWDAFVRRTGAQPPDEPG